LDGRITLTIAGPDPGATRSATVSSAATSISTAEVVAQSILAWTA
jgi:hypothetical protein